MFISEGALSIQEGRQGSFPKGTILSASPWRQNSSMTSDAIKGITKDANKRLLTGPSYAQNGFVYNCALIPVLGSSIQK